MGFLFDALFDPGASDPTAHAATFAVVGMAAFFTAVVRAPLTGIILVTEMTDNSRLLLPMLAACFSAMAVATMLREPPIYDALKERTLALLANKAGLISRRHNRFASKTAESIIAIGFPIAAAEIVALSGRRIYPARGALAFR